MRPTRAISASLKGVSIPPTSSINGERTAATVVSFSRFGSSFRHSLPRRGGEFRLTLVPLHPRTQSTVYCQHLPRYVIVRLEEEQDRASDIFGAPKSVDDFLLDEGIIFSALNALFGHSGVIDSGRHDIDPDSPLLCQNARSMDERRLGRRVCRTAGKNRCALHS